MNRSLQLRLIYAELRFALGNRVSARILLNCANSIIEICRSDRVERSDDQSEVKQPFINWPLDRAIADGGWRVLACERGRALPQYADDDIGVSSRYRLKGILEAAA
jgi:hypothetical protein